MKIVCGTNFGPRAAEAAEVAVELAARTGGRIWLAHALDSRLPSLLDQHPRDYLLGRLRKRLSGEADRWRAAGVPVEEHLGKGSPDRVLAELAEREEAALILVASPGRVRTARWLNDSSAERTAQSASVPTLAVRKTEPLLAWARGEKELKIFLGYDFSPSADTAVRFVASLSQWGACRVAVTYISWPPGETWRLGLGGQPPFAGNPPEVQALLEEDLRERCRSLIGRGQAARLRVLAGWGGISSQLLELAEAEEADLVVVGTNQRAGLDRFWLGSVSREILRRAPMNVLCVPAAAAETPPEAHVAFRRVLVPTDLSRLANTAIPFGYRAVQRGGKVLLVHVLPPNDLPPDARPARVEAAARRKQALLGRLRALVPPASEARGIQTQIEIVEHQHPAVGLCQAAERFRAELICMASAGRQKRLRGSVTESVLRRSHRPVLIVRD